jgi:hypothetical protein
MRKPFPSEFITSSFPELFGSARAKPLRRRTILMKIQRTVVLVFSLVVLSACAESGEPTKQPSITAPAPEQPSKEAVEEEIIQLERNWVAAIVAKDFAAIDGLLADEFNGTSPTGSTFPKSDAIKDLKSGQYKV